MHRTWQHLIIQNEPGLQDPGRIRKLCSESSHLGWLAVIGFLLGGVVSVFVGGFLFYTASVAPEKQLSLMLTGIVMGTLSIAFFISAGLFRKEMNRSPLRGFLKQPQDFIFIKGQLEDCYYLPGEKRSQDAIIVEGRAQGPNGEEILIQERFSPHIWNFTTPQADESLQKISDWYEKKHQRRLLPVPAYFICRKQRPVFAQLVAIDREFLSITTIS